MINRLNRHGTDKQHYPRIGEEHEVIKIWHNDGMRLVSELKKGRQLTTRYFYLNHTCITTQTYISTFGMNLVCSVTGQHAKIS